MRWIIYCSLGLGLLAAQSGCQIWRHGFAGSRIARFLPPDGTAEAATDGSSDPWIREAASEGRREFKTEKVNDPLGLRKYYMSDRAREIEANFGIVE